jgi:hypothetical protein
MSEPDRGAVVTASSSPEEHRSSRVTPFETSHQDNDEDDDDEEAFRIDAKEMVYAVESFCAIVQPGTWWSSWRRPGMLLVVG